MHHINHNAGLREPLGDVRYKPMVRKVLKAAVHRPLWNHRGVHRLDKVVKLCLVAEERVYDADIRTVQGRLDRGMGPMWSQCFLEVGPSVLNCLVNQWS